MLDTEKVKNTKVLIEDPLTAGNNVDLSFIIINYNLAKEIDDCLESLLEKINSAGNLEFEVIIVDNNSPDNDLPPVEKKYKNNNIKFYYLEENVGFGKGCNFGFSKASGKYICFLNPDTIIKEDIFLPVINMFKGDSKIGIIGPKQQVRPPLFDFSAGIYPNLLFELFNLAGMGVFLEGFLVSLFTKMNKNKNLRVDWILGAAIFIRAEIFEKINGFDRDYFMFYEEVDLCKRVSNEGYKIIYAPRLKIHHIGSVSGKKNYKLYTIRTYSSKNIFISKHNRSLKKVLMKSLLYIQLFSQILIWTVLYPVKGEKSKQKISAFFYLITHKLRLN